AIVEDCYPNKDFQRFFVGEIVKVLQAEDGE
ncbi:MAG: flavin reductase family protein, partial [Solobacterium sp.]|nr:flavin reductase family protein [Solobacterium sp.]